MKQSKEEPEGSLGRRWRGGAMLVLVAAVVVSLWSCEDLLGAEEEETITPVGTLPAEPDGIVDAETVPPEIVGGTLGLVSVTSGLVTDHFESLESPMSVAMVLEPVTIAVDPAFDETTGGTVTVTYASFLIPDTTVYLDGTLTLVVSFGATEDSLTVAGSLSISSDEYDYSSVTFDEMRWVFPPGELDGGMQGFPVSAGGGVSFDDTRYSAQTILTTTLHAEAAGTFIGDLLMESCNQFAEAHAGEASWEPYPGRGMTLRWNEQNERKIGVSFVNFAPLDGSTARANGIFEVQLPAAAPPYTGMIDGALALDSDSPLAYVAIDDLVLDWGNTAPDGPPASATGTITIDTSRYQAAYLIGLITTIEEIIGEEEEG
jgi:hypothetical protein